jgi:hypothetical protein
MMNLKEIDWKEFEKKYPEAYSFLIGRNLEREYMDLKNEIRNENIDYRRWQWVRERLIDIREIAPDIEGRVKKLAG